LIIFQIDQIGYGGANTAKLHSKWRTQSIWSDGRFIWVLQCLYQCQAPILSCCGPPLLLIKLRNHIFHCSSCIEAGAKSYITLWQTHVHGQVRAFTRRLLANDSLCPSVHDSQAGQRTFPWVEWRKSCQREMKPALDRLGGIDQRFIQYVSRQADI
jgi:hypothetical protein